MPNFATTLKSEISRLAAKEVRRGVPVLKRSSARYRREIASLKRGISRVIKQLNYLLKQQTRTAPVKYAQEGRKIRFSAQGLKKHRQKLDLSASDYGKLVGCSGLTVYLWEKGKNKPRTKHLPALQAVRGLRKKEARVKLELMR